MKRSMNRVLALMIALLIAVMPLSLAEEIGADNEQGQLTTGTEAASEMQEFDDASEVEVEDVEAVSALEPEIQETEDVELDTDIQDDSDSTVHEGPSDETVIAGPATPFDQCVTCDDVTISVAGVVGSFPEGATLQAEKIADDVIAQTVTASLHLEGTYHHNLLRIVVMDAAGNVILPNDNVELPLVCVKGLDVSEGIKAAVYDSISESAFDIEAQSSEDGIEFAFVDSTVYDVIFPVHTDDQQADEPAEEHPEGEPETEVPATEQTKEEPTKTDDPVENSEETEEQAGDEGESKDKSEGNEDESEDKDDTVESPKPEAEETGADADQPTEVVLDEFTPDESAKLAEPVYAAEAAAFEYLPSILTVGDVYDLKKCLLIDGYEPSDVISWKSSRERVVKISRDGMLTALKPGKARITVKTADRTKRNISVSVRANSIGGLFPRPSKADAVALGSAFSIRPKSLKYSGTKLVAEFYLLNGYKKALYNIRGLNLSVLLGNRTNKIASQYFSKIKTRRSKKRGVSTFTVTFSGSGILQKNVHLMDYTANQVYFDLDVASVYGKSGRKTVPFVATVIPNVPAPVLVSGIVLNAESLSLNVGDSTQLTATVLPENAENKAYLWSSSDSNVVSVDGGGVVKANAVGTATIMVAAVDGSGVTASCTVTVIDPNESSAVDYSEEVSKITLQELSTGRELVKGESIDYDISNGGPQIGTTLITARLAENAGKLRFIAYGMNEKPDFDRYYLNDNKAGDYLFNGDISQSDILDCVITG